MLKSRISSVSLVVATSILLGLQGSAPAVATLKEPDYLCYMQTRSRRLVDLTASVCGFKSPSAAMLRRQAAFLRELRRNAGSFPEGRFLLQLADRNPDLLVSKAQNFCASRRAGMTEGQIMEGLYGQFFQGRPTQNFDDRALQQELYTAYAAHTLAPKHFCPDMAYRGR